MMPDPAASVFTSFVNSISFFQKRVYESSVNQKKKKFLPKGGKNFLLKPYLKYKANDTSTMYHKLYRPTLPHISQYII